MPARRGVVPPVRFLPNHLRHQSRREPVIGKARATYGLLLRGVVTNVYVPDAAKDVGRAVRRPFDARTHNSILCDVLIIEQHYKTHLKDVPVMVGSAGLNDHAVWIPRATTLSTTGEKLSISPDGSTQRTTATHDMDGDHVIVAFLANDANQPVIIGQIAHPNTNRRPSALAVTQFKWRKFLRGIDIGITDGGDVLVNLTNASDGSITTTGAEVPDPTAGNVTMTMPAAAKFKLVDAVASSLSTALRGRAYLTDRSTLLGAETTFLTAEGTYLAAHAVWIAAVAVAVPALAGAATTFGSAIATYITAQGTYSTAVGVHKSAVDTSIASLLPYLSKHLELD